MNTDITRLDALKERLKICKQSLNESLKAQKEKINKLDKSNIQLLQKLHQLSIDMKILEEQRTTVRTELNHLQLAFKSTNRKLPDDTLYDLICEKQRSIVVHNQNELKISEETNTILQECEELSKQIHNTKSQISWADVATNEEILKLKEELEILTARNAE